MPLVPLWIISYLLGCAVYALTVILILPDMLLKNRYAGGAIADRGLKRFKLGDSDYAILYMPERKVRKYIDKYILSTKNGEKYFTCHLTPGIKYIDFDILLFDKNHDAFLSLNSKNIVDGQIDIDDIKLPIETAYVALSLNQVNEKRSQDTRKIRLSIPRIALYFVAVVLVSLAFSMVTKLCIGNLFAGVFRDDFFENVGESILLLVVTAVVTIITSIISAVMLVRKNARK